MATKTVWKYFTIAQWEEENEWINKMAQDGWHLERIDFLLRYIFVKGNKGEYIYKLDLPDNIECKDDKQSYKNLITERGIDIVHEQGESLYLRKKSIDGPFDEKATLSSKLIMCNKAYNYAIKTLTKSLQFFSILMCLLVLSLSLIEQTTIKSSLKVYIMCVGIDFIVSSAFWVPTLNSLRKKMNKLVSEIDIKY